jgi:Amt family ammonium transporter
MAHMVWYWAGPDAYTSAEAADIATATAGWLFQKGALDFAGGTVVHINAAVAGLVGAYLVGKRVGYGRDSMAPHSLAFTMIGASLLWFGWFGFNAGSELTADAVTALAFLNTQVATAAALLGWITVEWLRTGRPTLVGASSGAVAGLVAITPACAFLAPWAAVLLGLVAGAACAFAVGLKYRLGFDDSLDVVGIHFVGGWIGCLWIGLFGAGELGLFTGGGIAQLGKQALGAGIASVWSFVVALLIALVVKATIGLRVAPEAEIEGIDIAEHQESAYDLTQSGGGGDAFAQAGLVPGPPTSLAPVPPAPVLPAPAPVEVRGGPAGRVAR